MSENGMTENETTSGSKPGPLPISEMGKDPNDLIDRELFKEMAAEEKVADKEKPDENKTPVDKEVYGAMAAV